MTDAKELQSKCTVYVGGLAPEVTREVVHAAFLPFGEIVSVSLPSDPRDSTGGHRGYAFVEFDSADDASHAIENMHGAEVYGKVLKVSLSKQFQGFLADRSKPVWAQDTDAYMRQLQKESEEKKAAKAKEAERVIEKMKNLAKPQSGPSVKY